MIVQILVRSHLFPLKQELVQISDHFMNCKINITDLFPRVELIQEKLFGQVVLDECFNSQ